MISEGSLVKGWTSVVKWAGNGAVAVQAPERNASMSAQRDRRSCIKHLTKKKRPKNVPFYKNFTHINRLYSSIKQIQIFVPIVWVSQCLEQLISHSFSLFCLVQTKKLIRALSGVNHLLFCRLEHLLLEMMGFPDVKTDTSKAGVSQTRLPVYGAGYLHAQSCPTI